MSYKQMNFIDGIIYTIKLFFKRKENKPNKKILLGILIDTLIEIKHDIHNHG